jgi:hypothetical protein
MADAPKWGRQENLPATGFSIAQLRKLVRPLDRMRVKTRVRNGKSLDYIEGWFAISEANAIFGYAGWDREMAQFEKVFEGKDGRETQCAYLARIRITVRAGHRLIVREGTGWGEARSLLRADAHERALKAAETDATKRALATFGGRFGLALYDKDVRAAMPPRPIQALTPFMGYELMDEKGAMLARGLSAEGFCSGLRQLIDAANVESELDPLLDANRSVLDRLRAERPDLCSQKGRHFADILESLAARRLISSKMNIADAGRETAGDRASALNGAALGESPEPTALGEMRQEEPPPTSPPSGHEASGTLDGASGVMVNGNSKAPSVVDGVEDQLVRASAMDQLAVKSVSPTNGLRPSRIGNGMAVDKSCLAVGTAKRVRDKAHLLFVASQPCLICAASPCHAHHLTFAQPRGLALKVSDEFTVPLCVIHHNALHGHHQERAFWRFHQTDALAEAKRLWQISQSKNGNGVTPA